MVRDTLLVFGCLLRVLLDSGASHSFFATSSVWALGSEVDQLESDLCVNTLVGGGVYLDLGLCFEH